MKNEQAFAENSPLLGAQRQRRLNCSENQRNNLVGFFVSTLPALTSLTTGIIAIALKCDTASKFAINSLGNCSIATGAFSVIATVCLCCCSKANPCMLCCGPLLGLVGLTVGSVGKVLC